MGIWCLNCMDEINFFKDIYEKYYVCGLEIVFIVYEVVEMFDGQV